MNELTEYYFYWYLADKILKISLVLSTDNECDVMSAENSFNESKCKIFF